MIGHDAQKNRVKITPAITVKKRYPIAMKSECREIAYSPVIMAIIPSMRPIIPYVALFIPVCRTVSQIRLPLPTAFKILEF